VFKSNIKLLGWSAIIIIIDQFAKILIKQFMLEKESVSVIGDILRLTYIKNPGMAFGIQIGGKLFYTIFASIACVIILVYLFRLRPENFWARFALASILGGAIGNLIDRFIYSEVVDFIDIRIIRWPVFNFADIAVFIGMIVLIAVVIFERNREEIESEEEQLETG
jgi:signal peptidase II